MAQKKKQQSRSDEDLVPMDDRVKIGVSNFKLVPENKQAEPMYQVTVEILKQYPFYNALTMTAEVPEIYMQQFWHTVAINTETQTYHFMIDDQQFELGADLFRDAFQITPRVPNQEFVEPPSNADLLSFIKQLGYLGSRDQMSYVNIDFMYQPWRAFMTIINKCLTGKSSGHDRPRTSMIQILWGMFTNKNVDYANLIWDEFKFQIDSRVSYTKKQELLPYYRFTKVIIKHILSKHNSLSKRPKSWTHTIEYDSVLGRLKFVRKLEEHIKYGMSIPDVMMSDTIRNSADYMKYLANSTSSVPKVFRKRGKRSMSKKIVDVDVQKKKKKKKKDDVPRKSRRLHETHTSLVIGREKDVVPRKSPRLLKGADDHPKKKLKGVATEGDVVQSLLNLKQGYKASRNDVDHEDISDKSNSGSDEEVEVISHDERTETDGAELAENIQVPVLELENDVLKDPIETHTQSLMDVENPDVQETSIIDTVMSTSPTKTTQSPKPNSPQNKTNKRLKKEFEINAVLQRLMKLEKKVDAMSKVDHTSKVDPTDAIEKSVKAHLKKELSKVVPDFGKIQVSAASENVQRSLPKSSTTTSDSDSVKEYDMKDELFQLMTKSKSFKTHPSHQKLYDALMESLLVDEDNFDKQYDIQPTPRKRHHEDQDTRERRVTRSRGVLVKKS